MANSLFDSYLKQFGRYPDPKDTEELILGNFPKSDRTTSVLKNYDKQLYIDVTHTVHYPYNSGIQRVVRRLVTAMKDNGASFDLLKFDLNGQPVLLTSHEVDKFYNWEKYIHATPTSVHVLAKLARVIGPFAKRIFPSFLWSIAKTIYHKTIALLNAKPDLKSAMNATAIINLTGKKLLLPEVVTEPERINAVNILSKYYNVSVSTILYDLIPITHPEYCTVGYDFVHYLRIFRSIEKVFAISKHTESELKKIMEFLPREVANPLLISTVYIGGDFHSVTSRKNQEVTLAKKTVLLVARFEPRKNIRRILVAARRLFEESMDFKFVIVGNPGWLQESILADLENLKAKGYDVEYHMRIPDAALVEWYQKSYFTVFCSITEGFGLPIIESVLMGKPCLTADSGSQAEVGTLIKGCDFANPFDSDDIYKKMKALLTNQQHYLNKVLETKSARWPSWTDYARQIQSLL